MHIQVNDVEKTTKTNLQMMEQTYRLICKVMDVSIYNSNKNNGDPTLPLLQADGRSNSELLQEAASSIVAAIFREKFSV